MFRNIPGGVAVKNPPARTFLVFQWLRLCTPNARGQGLIPGQETRSLIAQLKRSYTWKLKPGTVK